MASTDETATRKSPISTPSYRLRLYKHHRRRIPPSELSRSKKFYLLKLTRKGRILNTHTPTTTTERDAITIINPSIDVQCPSLDFSSDSLRFKISALGMSGMLCYRS